MTKKNRAEEISEEMKKKSDGDLSSEELESIAGGKAKGDGNSFHHTGCCPDNCSVGPTR